MFVILGYFINLFNGYLLSVRYVLSIVLRVADILINKIGKYFFFYVVWVGLFSCKSMLEFG